MASRKEQKEALRQRRLEAESQEQRTQRRQRMLGLGVAGLLTLAVVAGIVAVVLAGGDDGADTAAHIVARTGTTEGLEPDEREGTAPTPVEIANLKDAAKAAKCKLREDLPNEGRNHLIPGEEPPKYKTNPPTSGDHDATPVADGAYVTMPPPEKFLHSLEHGRIQIQYSPSLPEADQLALKGLFDEDFVHMVMFPNDEMSAQVAVSAWQNLMTCKKYDPEVPDAIRDFRDAHRDQGPETVP
jgi:hypothetical protein